MAKIAFKSGDDYALKISRLATGSDEISKKAIAEAAGVVADEIKKNLQDVLSEEASGEMMDAFGIAPIDLDNRGNWNTKIGFDGYDSNGIANQLKARVLESGSSKQKKRPFVRPAVNATKKLAIEKMRQVIDREIAKLKL